MRNTYRRVDDIYAIFITFADKNDEFLSGYHSK
jgi:hypothetical protein